MASWGGYNINETWAKVNFLMIQTVYEQFSAAAKESPELTFLCYPPSDDRGYLSSGAEFSYGNSLDLIDALATSYIEAGFVAGHRVALLLGNLPDHFWHLLALNSIGASVVPLNPAYMDHELEYAIKFANCALVVTTADRVEDLNRVCLSMSPHVSVFGINAKENTIPTPTCDAEVIPSAKGDREALIIYTSGTTGRPKGCIISNTSCLAAGESYGEAGGLINFEPGKDRLYIPLPAFHMNVSVYTLNTTTRLRNCIVLQDRFRASTWWSDIYHTKATCLHYMGIIPPLLIKSEKSQYENCHKVKFGQGAGVDPVVREEFESRFGFPLIEAWGMTETSRAIQNCRIPRDPAGRAFGFPRAPLEVLVVDENDNPVPFSTPGELLVRCAGENPRHGFFSGYLKQPEETEKVWRLGWFHTGDVVIQRDDGMLSFVDRKKNIIRRSGENIAAAEVEEALIEDSKIKSVAVLAAKDEFHDEEIHACIVLMPNSDASELTAKSIFDFGRSRLITYKLPGWISFVDKIPVTGTQKIRKEAIFSKDFNLKQDVNSFDMRSFKRKKVFKNE